MDATTIFYLFAMTIVCVITIYWAISDMRLTRADRQQYAWYKHASIICVFAFLLLVASRYILLVFFPNNLPEKIIGIAIDVCAIAIVAYCSWLGFREKKSRRQLLSKMVN